jgi:hypothetical protein
MGRLAPRVDRANPAWRLREVAAIFLSSRQNSSSIVLAADGIQPEAQTEGAICLIEAQWDERLLVLA